MQEAEFQFFTNSVLHELQYGHTVTPEFEERTENLLKSMGMWECRDRHPFSLSGGQMQKLTLMMAYLSDKPVIVLDEPTAGQDAESLERCAALIREMWRKKTVLIITHDLELIAKACGRCIGLSNGQAETEFPIASAHDLQAVRQYMESFRPAELRKQKQHRELLHPATKLIFWLTLMVVISAANNHLVYASYASLILLTAADGWFGTALMGGLSFAVLWAAGYTVSEHGVFIYAGAVPEDNCHRHFNADAHRAQRGEPHLGGTAQYAPAGAIYYDRRGDLPLFPVLSGDMKLLRQSIRTRGAFATPWQKLRALPSYIEILTVPMALRVIRIAETLSASAETRGIDLKRRKSNYLSLSFSAWDAVLCSLLAVSVAAGLIL